MILAAGLGTRLKPWTLSHPKALVPIRGVPMLERVILNLKKQGFSYIVVNIHHFGEQIIEFLRCHDFGVKIAISDERNMLLDTGGGILNAQSLLSQDNSPFLIHNVDILSDADLSDVMTRHTASKAGATLLVSRRKSSRKLIFTPEMHLKGWHNISSGEFIPNDISPSELDLELSFSGIHVMDMSCLEQMNENGFFGKFSIMDFYLKTCGSIDIRGYECTDLHLIDIGKPETLEQANSQSDLFFL